MGRELLKSPWRHLTCCNGCLQGIGTDQVLRKKRAWHKNCRILITHVAHSEMELSRPAVQHMRQNCIEITLRLGPSHKKPRHLKKYRPAVALILK